MPVVMLECDAHSHAMLPPRAPIAVCAFACASGDTVGVRVPCSGMCLCIVCVRDRAFAHVNARVCVCSCVCFCVHVHARACVCVHTHVFQRPRPAPSRAYMALLCDSGIAVASCAAALCLSACRMGSFRSYGRGSLAHPP